MTSQGRLIVLVSLFFAAAFSGCAKDQSNNSSGGDGGWNAFPVPIYADAQISSNSQAESDFKDAIAFWEAKAGKPLFSYQGAYTGTPYMGTSTTPGTIISNVIMMQNPWPFAMDIAGQTTTDSTGGAIAAAVIMINPNITFCGGDCTGATNETSQRKTFTHELGHFLGLVHVQDISNIMYPVIQPGGTLTSVTIDQSTFETLVAD